MNLVVDHTCRNISSSEGIGCRRGRVSDARRSTALRTACGGNVLDIDAGDANGCSSQVVDQYVESAAGRNASGIDWDYVFGYCLLVPLAHACDDVVVGVVLYESPYHDVESHQ